MTSDSIDKTLTNPTVKLLARALVALALAYITLMVTSIHGRIDDGEKIDARQDAQLQSDAIWRAQRDTEWKLRESESEQYTKALQAHAESNERALVMFREVLDELKRARK
jgi:hypothetical protein